MACCFFSRDWTRRRSLSALSRASREAAISMSRESTLWSSAGEGLVYVFCLFVEVVLDVAEDFVADIFV
ncbi:hypothetical protein ACQ86N_31465 [Puia sp. P3]|uniref:hypothetical protein n=1 Tax=Puia sp. P3 TaxID=3423952 RepID=UPI003D666058